MEAKKIKQEGRGVLGRGLSALISSSVPVSLVRGSSEKIELPSVQSTPSLKTSSEGTAHFESQDLNGSNRAIKYVNIDKLIPSALQPRKDFKESELKELAESITTLGLLQPILVRPKPGDPPLEIIAGERRWRAAKLAHISQLPVIIHEISDREALEIALVENIQRDDLNPIEQAQGFKRLSEEYSLTHIEIAERVGKDRATVSNLLRILTLPQEITGLVRSGALTVGHAKAILTVREPSAQLALSRKAVKESLSVRDLEAIVSRVIVLDGGKPNQKGRKLLSGSNSQTLSFPDVIDRLRNALGTKVNIKHHKSGRGRVEIEYFSEQELDRVVEAICRA